MDPWTMKMWTLRVCGPLVLWLMRVVGRGSPWNTGTPSSLGIPRRGRLACRVMRAIGELAEYEQLLYHYYKRYVERYDPGGSVWATARMLHGRAFRDYYGRHGENVWSVRRAGAVAKTYVYSVLGVWDYMPFIVFLAFIVYIVLESMRRRPEEYYL